MRKLKTIKKKQSGRDVSGRVSVRHQGGEHKRFLRAIDFRRDKKNITGKVVGIEYDPNRTSDIALIQYDDGEKRYILAPEGLKLNDIVISGAQADLKVGNAMPLSQIPIGTFVHNIEITPGRGGQMARSAGTSAAIAAHEDGYVHLRLPSKEVRKVRSSGFATIGNLGNIDWKNEVIGSAGRKRHMGIRPTVRGVAQNPRSHPHGGGEGRTGIGMPGPKTYRGRSAVGKTRRKNKYSNKCILQRRKK
ncbi:MAG: 50S ribosomal protein L2 [Candidatus Levybacteria bacterium RIFCSPLOWO2_02_FULL_37_10]|nr:MAG: 50S ribosomal protein L2 [Candidatus Levybacteria bacterium RIFCSPHIGHO2_01_FULL_37_33]OGH17495.1 MAG: 50S ribosomal protein L2 [Candidatus Levybacteria bacterium RIFCSPHIGHO2_02_FULL_37_11]OGH29407.1 MAG: 50S ribosomal protein L2 [Candidatus Levybacteria bacterium RIFCSPHIGHO2_12_FULL_37_12]OGH32915.1 MAG: 50S ribosomal protein L2 [Candidatus Levybacteria bacterium RIFCSPLOWO2_01_FULL_36_54]OGH43297.1 MAG: 50S ribosomal protein L2 [Candidatus Levybacteria bacterium RIFCSPLOWO2_02_FULL_